MPHFSSPSLHFFRLFVFFLSLSLFLPLSPSCSPVPTDERQPHFVPGLESSKEKTQEYQGIDELQNHKETSLEKPAEEPLLSPDDASSTELNHEPREELPIQEEQLFSEEIPIPEPPPVERTSQEKHPDKPATGTPCTVNGIRGTCLHVKDCTGDRISTAGHCPGPKDIQCCTKKPPPSNTCTDKQRPQPNVGLKESPGDKGCPSGMVKIGNFCIDRYEASLVEVLSNGSTRPWSPFFNPGKTKVRALSIKGATPQGYINGYQAEAACKEAGKRLCTDQEWLRACRGPSNYKYPYGNKRQPGDCNDARSIHPAVEYFRSSASWVFSKIQHPCINQLKKSLLKTGQKTKCITHEKVYDMMGNLHEWTSNSTGIFRGGYYVDTYRNGDGCLYRTTAHTRGHWDYSTGFRCCANAKP